MAAGREWMDRNFGIVFRSFSAIIVYFFVSSLGKIGDRLGAGSSIYRIINHALSLERGI